MKTTRGTVAFLAFVASACTGHSPLAPTPSARTSVQPISVPLGAASGGSTPLSLMASPYGGHGIPLIEVQGTVPSGAAGIVDDTQTDEPGFNNFELNVNVHGAPPDTDLYFQFTADIVPGTRGDGTCPAFPAPPANAIGVLHTSPGGAASTHLKFEVPEGAFLGAFDSGVTSDWQWRVVNLAETFDLRTPCIVLTGK